MGVVNSFREEKYSGRVYEAKDNIVIETSIDTNSVKLSSPIDLIDGMLRDYIDEEVKITISVKIEKL